MPHSHTHKNSRGFTLIELMIVIGIIGMLMALTFPVVNKLKERSKEIQCANNMRQWMSAMMQYVDANKSVFPTDGTTGDDRNAWFEVLPPLIGLDPYSVQSAEPARVPAPGLGRSVFICPSYRTDKAFMLGNIERAYSYGMNFWVNSADKPAEFTERMRLSQLKRADIFVVFAETEDYKKITVNLHGSDGASKPAFRHGKKTLCGFADGHVEAVNKELAPTRQWNPKYLNPDYEADQEPAPKEQ